MTQRKAFNFYASYWEQIKLLNDKQKLDIFTAICSVQFLEVNINDVVFNDKTCTLVWTGVKHSIHSSLYGFINKNKSIGYQVVEPLSMGGCQQVQLKEKEQYGFNFKKSLLDLGIESNIVIDYLKVRRNKKATNSETAFNSIKKELAKSNLSANESIQIAVEKSWSGFKAEWLNNLNNGTHQQNNNSESKVKWDNVKFH